jgi:hypothetical protein
VPRLAGVITVLLSLDPDRRVGKKIRTIDMVPVRVRNDDVGDGFRIDACCGDGDSRGAVVTRLPLVDELLTVEAGVDEHDPAVRALQQPDHHRNVEAARAIRAGHEPGHGKRR